jgi:general secretion pathway protein I
MTLVEVLIALAIFLLAMVVFGDMMVQNGQIALNIQRQNLATRLCRSKLQEVAAGVVPLTGQDDTPFDEEPDYSWSLQAQNGAVDGLWNVTVHVTRRQTDGGEAIQCTLMQMMLDPSIEGSTQDAVPVTVSDPTASSGSSSSSSSTPASTSTTGK